MLVIGPDSLGLAQLQAHMNKQEYGELSSTMASSFKAAGAPISHYEVGRAKLVPSQCCTPCDLRTGMAPPIMDWALPQQSLIKRTHNRLAYSLILWEAFFSIEVPSSLMTLAYVELT